MAATSSSVNDESLTTLANGRKLYVQRRGKIGGPALIFAHGLGSRSEVYGPVHDALGLADSHDLIYFDFNGSGRSPLIGELTIDSLAEDIVGLLDVFKTKQATIVGHSMSGLVALTLAARFPDHVERVVTIGGIKALPEAARKAMGARAGIARTKGTVELAATIVDAAVSQRTLSSNRLAYNYVRTLIAASPSEGYARAVEAIVSAHSPDFSKIKAPTLIINGSEDKTAPPSVGAEIAQAIGDNARTLVQPDVGHWNPIEAPEDVAKAIGEFCSSASPM